MDKMEFLSQVVVNYGPPSKLSLIKTGIANQEEYGFPKDNPVVLGTNNEIDASSERKAVWLEKDCKLLISLYKSYNPVVGKTLECRNKKKMWVLICDKMIAHGSNFSARQIEDKWRNMERDFKNKLFHKKKTGRGSSASMQFGRELSEVLLEKSATVPEFVLEKSRKGSTHKEILDNTDLLFGEAEPEVVIEDELQEIMENQVEPENTFDNTVQNVRKNTVLEKIALFSNENKKFPMLKENRLQIKEPNLKEYKEHTSSEKKTIWLEKDRKLLASLYKNFKSKLGKTLECRTKRKMWKLICDKMVEHGCNFSARQIEDKWRNMERRSQNKQLSTDRGRVSLERPTIVPECFPGSSGKGSTHEQILYDSSLLFEEGELETHMEVTFPKIMEHQKTLAEKVTLFKKEKEKFPKPKLRRLLCKEPLIEEEKKEYFNEYKEQTSSEKAIWLEKDCKLLMRLYKEFNPEVGNTLKNKKKMWAVLCDKMITYGCNFSAKQIEHKWHNMEKNFINKQKKTGHASASEQYGSSKRRIQKQIFDDSGFLFEDYHPSVESETPIEEVFREVTEDQEKCENTFENAVKNVRKKNTVSEEIGLFRELLERKEKHLQSKEAKRNKEKEECLEAYKARTEAINKLTGILIENLQKC